jgi:hypothetical protein
MRLAQILANHESELHTTDLMHTQDFGYRYKKYFALYDVSCQDTRQDKIQNCGPKD